MNRVSIGPAYRKGIVVREAAEQWASFRVPDVVSGNRISRATRRVILTLMARAFEAGYEFARTRNVIVSDDGFIERERVA